MTARRNDTRRPTPPAKRRCFPFTAIVGQEEMKLALLLNVIAPSIGGVFITGHRGTGKSTAVRALADLLPTLNSVRDCAFNCDPRDEDALCTECRARLDAGTKIRAERRAVPVVELPLGATEDRVCGTFDLGRAVREGVRVFEPGLLARANRGFLYVDEVNLLADHLVDLLLDVAATGRNRVEREGVSTEHPARFVLVGSSNPEEGELRPQLLDRFGLCAEVSTIADIESRVLIVERREAFERDPARYAESARAAQESLRRRLSRARRGFERVTLPRPMLRSIAELCVRLKVDGHRGELTIARAARALAALEGRKTVSTEDVRRVAAMSLRHRLRRDPLEQMSGGGRIDESMEELFGDTQARTASGESMAAAAGHASGNAPTDKRDDEGEAASRGHSHGDAPDSLSGDAPQSTGDGPDAGRTSVTNVAPPIALSLPEELIQEGEVSARRRSEASVVARRVGARKTTFAARGRYAGASASKPASGSLALDATLRAAAVSRSGGQDISDGRGLKIAAGDLRFKRFRGKTGTLFIFAVDTSGSMAVNRIGQAKGALSQLLRQSYVRRDRVSLVSFRDGGAQILLPQCGAPSRALRILEALPCGGATPLAAGLLRALEVARGASRSGPPRVVLVIFTDGRANQTLVPSRATSRAEFARLVRREIEGLGAALRESGVTSVVVDTQNRFTSSGEGQTLAAALGGRYIQLPRTNSLDEFKNALKGLGG
ncbi:MAG: magnesium chelatase ATPase subunit I [Acidobacteria bacterium]|nr:magnesium chelatase ATPase subunit I [Acidobacteriota bacterium]